MARRVDEMAENVVLTLKDTANNFVFYSLCLDESTDVSDTTQLAIFIRGVDIKLNITEELLDLVSMKGTTTAEDLYSAFYTALEKKNIPLSKLCGIATDGAPSMRGNRSGLTTLLATKLKTEFSRELFVCHCVIHIENLCAKSIQFQNVMQIVISTVNFIRSKALNHRQFMDFLADMNAEYGDAIYFSEVRWLSRAKGKDTPQFNDNCWVGDLAFLVDVTCHLSDLNIKMQGKNMLINELLTHVKTFMTKLSLWRKQLKNNNLANFPNLLGSSATCHHKYADVTEDISSEFEERFADFIAKEDQIRIFTAPFAVEIETLPEELQMEMIELESNSDLKDAFKDNIILEFYRKYVSQTKYPYIVQHACRILSLFASTYTCEQVFSLMKMTKTKNRSTLTDDHLKNSLILASTNIRPNIPQIVDKHQCQKSH